MKKFLISDSSPEYSLYIEVKKPLPKEVAKHLYRCAEALSNHFEKKIQNQDLISTNRE